MRKWPKHVCLVCAEDPALAESCPDEDKAEVIPADLGRELYEAIRPIQDQKPVGVRLKALGFDDWELELKPIYAALARYEREVGK